MIRRTATAASIAPPTDARRAILMTVAVVTALFMVLVRPSSAQSVDAADLAAAQSVIASQIEAFRADDGPAAYAHAAPLIKQMFPTPDMFMTMVRNGYQPVYRPQSFSFSDIRMTERGLTQDVEIIGPKGGGWLAEYTFEKDASGTLKINGVRLKKLPGASV